MSEINELEAWAQVQTLFADLDPSNPRYRELVGKYSECTEGDASLFSSENGRDIEAAKAICGNCAVREQCLILALATQEPFGVWGGTTEQDRQNLLSRKVYAANRRRA